MLNSAREINHKLSAPNEDMPSRSFVYPELHHGRPRQGTGYNRHSGAYDKAGVQRFLNMVGYVHKFIPKMADIAKPLSVLLSNDVE